MQIKVFLVEVCWDVHPTLRIILERHLIDEVFCDVNESTGMS